MMKGYLTVFLSLSLSLLIGVILVLTQSAVRNGGKERLEGAMDIGMNAVLGEYGTALLDRYGLLYLDASYLGQKPSAANVESRLVYYINKNLNPIKRGLWGKLYLQEAAVISFQTAVSGNGVSMKRQAAAYAEDCKIHRKEAQVTEYMEAVEALANKDAEEEWKDLMEELAGTELPLVMNQKGQWEEVPLGNPADSVFALLGSDILYLINADLDSVGTESIPTGEYISNRSFQASETEESGEADEELFLQYLFEKMGNYRRAREDAVLHCQLEYIVSGKGSDFENLEAVAETLMKWRFADNAACIFSDSFLCGEARAAARELYAVQLKPELEEPVARSLLYACAYLETVGDLKCLFSGGCVAFPKKRSQTGMAQVMSGSITEISSEAAGLCYEQYLSCMLLRLSEKEKNLRVMDIMEMDLRRLTNNPHFAMDWCLERLQAEILVKDGLGKEYRLTRTYGYY